MPSERESYVIVVGVDYSDASVVALDLALEQAAHRPATTLVPALVLAPAATPQLMAADGDFVASAMGNLEQLVRSRLEAKGSGGGGTISVSAVVGFGDPADYLTRLADERHASLLVVGTHGRSGIGRVVLGSVAGSVIQGAGCPVLVARPPKSTESETEATPASIPNDEDGAASEAAGGPSSSIISELHIADGAVVVYVLDDESGRTFVCSFQSRTNVTVESLERDWVAVSTAAERARALHAAETYVRENATEFQRLIDELNRRRHAARD